MKKIDVVLNKIIKLCNPTSIFLYGSRARTDFLKRSDFEIGVLIPENRYFSRSDIKKNINIPNVSIYPFKLEDFTKSIIDTPFQKSVYLRELISAGKTLYGKKIIEHISNINNQTVSTDTDLSVTLGFKNGGTTKKVLIKGVVGLVCPSVDGTTCSF